MDIIVRPLAHFEHYKDVRRTITERPDPAIVRNWLDYAQRDLKAAYELQRAGGLSGIVAFHAQQAAEKALKALTLQCGGEQCPDRYGRRVWSCLPTILKLPPPAGLQCGRAGGLQAMHC